MALFYSLRRLFGGAPGAPAREFGTQQIGPLTYAAGQSVEVTVESAMQISAVWAAVRLITESIGSMPFNLYDIRGDDRKPAVNHDLYHILTQQPNQYQTPVEFWESIALNLALAGNAYLIKQKAGKRIVGLLPVSTQQMSTDLLDDGRVVHTLRNGADVRVYSSDSMWHIKLLGNGIVGLSPLAYARGAVGIAVAGEGRVSDIYANGAKPSGVLSIDRLLTDEQRAQVRTRFKGLEQGSDDRLFVLEAGMKYQQVSMSPQDIQLLDSRRFQIEDIGRFFGVPSILLNQTYGQSSLGSNVKEIFEAFYKLALRPYLERIEASVIRWLIDPAEREFYQAEFNFDALLRPELITRMQAYREAIHSGQMTPNEARHAEGRPAIDGGDRLMIQSATVPIEQAGIKPAGGNTNAV